MSIPKFPLSRIIREGTIGDCPKCKSTTLRKHEWGILGRWGDKIGCLQPQCENYYEDNKQYKRDMKLKKLGI